MSQQPEALQGLASYLLAEARSLDAQSPAALKSSVDTLKAWAKEVSRLQSDGWACGLCGESEAFTGTCGGGRANPKALCFQGAHPPAAPALVPLTAEQRTINGHMQHAIKLAGRIDGADELRYTLSKVADHIDRVTVDLGVLAMKGPAQPAFKLLDEQQVKTMFSASEVFEYHPGAVLEFTRTVEAASAKLNGLTVGGGGA